MNELLFWKVYRNKFLKNKIINYIQSIEWIKFDEINQLHIDNRIKFKDIHSLEWMLENEQYQLIHMKLDNNEYIHINKLSVFILFCCITKKELLKEILIKLLSKRRNEFEIVDLTFEAVRCECYEGLDILTNGEPFSIPIYLSTFKYSLENCSVSIVLKILKINRKNNNLFWRNDESSLNSYIKSIDILDSISKNQKYGHELFNFIFFNSSFSKFQKSSIFFKEEDFNLDSDQDGDEEVNKKIKLSSSSSSLSEPIQELLSNLNLVFSNSRLNSNILKYDWNLMDSSIEELISTYKALYFSTISEFDQINDLSVKQLQALIIIKLQDDISEKSYKEYIKKYRETIDECHLEEEKDDGGDNEQQEETLKSYQKFLRIYKLFHSIDEINISRIEIIKDCNNGTLEWNQFLLDLALLALNYQDETYIVINDRSIIDWMLNCKNSCIKSFILDRFYKISFGTIELANYVYKESNLLNHLSTIRNPTIAGINDKYIYAHLWYCAVKESNFNQIKYLESLNININDLCLFYSIDIIKSTIISIDQTIKILNYFNESGFNKFSNNISTIETLFYQIVLVFSKNMNEFSKLQLNITNKDSIIISILSQNLEKMYLKVVELIFNSSIFNDNQYIYNIGDNINMIQLFNQFSNNLFKIPNNQVLYTENICYLYEKKQGITRLKIINLIKKILIRIKESNLNTNQDNNSPISLIINYLFEKFIQIKGISMDEVKEVYKLIKDESGGSFTIQHNLYHSFWYLHIKDIKYIYYITSPLFIGIFSIGRLQDYYNVQKSQQGNTDKFYLENYLKPSEFTFESIDNLPFDTVLEMLVNKLSPMIESFTSIYGQTEQLFNKQHNRDLEYYLIIRRVDLFFIKLNEIKLILDNKSNSQSLFSKSLNSNNSLSNQLLPNSTFFNNEGDNSFVLTIPPTLLYTPQPSLSVVVYTFEFLNNVIKSIVKLLNLDEIKRVIKSFNYHQSTFIYKLYKKSIHYERFDIVKLLLDNFKITIRKLPIKSESPSDVSVYSRSLFILENYFNFVQYPCKFKIEYQTQTQTQQQHLINQETGNCSCKYNELEDNIFLLAFIKGDIQLSELILHHYHSNYKFKITKESITTAIKNENIHIVNHFLNNHFNIFDLDKSSLINHLKLELNNNKKDYNCLNILE